LRLDLAEMLERREQARHADREAGGRHRLAAEARDEAIVAPAAADRAKAHGPAALVLRLERQLHLVDRAGVILEAAHDRRIDADAVAVATLLHQLGDRLQLGNAFIAAPGL